MSNTFRLLGFTWEDIQGYIEFTEVNVKDRIVTIAKMTIGSFPATYMGASIKNPKDAYNSMRGRKEALRNLLQRNKNPEFRKAVWDAFVKYQKEEQEWMPF